MCYRTTKKTSGRKRQRRAHKEEGKNSARRPRNVKFGEVEIIEFMQILGDHPDVSDGPPLTFGWKPLSHRKEDIQSYDTIREPYRRTGLDLVIPRAERFTQ